MSYTLGEAYTKDYWLNLAKNMENMGADSICLEGHGRTPAPVHDAYELLSALKQTVSVPIQPPYALHERCRCHDLP